MADDLKVTCRSGDAGSMLAPVWIMGWLFSIGFLKLTFWKGVLALLIWPYYFGVFFRK